MHAAVAATATAASVGLEYSVLGLLTAVKSTGTADTLVREIVKAIYRGTTKFEYVHLPNLACIRVF